MFSEMSRQLLRCTGMRPIINANQIKGVCLAQYLGSFLLNGSGSGLETILAPVVGAGFLFSILYIFSMSVECAVRIGTSILSPLRFSVLLG